MSPERKLLKIFCFLLVICGVASVIVGVLALTGADEVATETRPWLYGLGAWGIAEGVLGMLLAGAGIRGANTPRKASAAKAPGVVAAVLAAGGVAASAVCPAGLQVATLVAGVAALVLSLCCAVWAGKVAEQAER